MIKLPAAAGEISGFMKALLHSLQELQLKDSNRKNITHGNILHCKVLFPNPMVQLSAVIPLTELESSMAVYLIEKEVMF